MSSPPLHLLSRVQERPQFIVEVKVLLDIDVTMAIYGLDLEKWGTKLSTGEICHQVMEIWWNFPVSGEKSGDIYQQLARKAWLYECISGHLKITITILS